MDNYMTLKEAAKKWGIGDRRINALCLQGRIEGATRIGNMWVIPTTTMKPSDARIKTGKYVKEKS
ncbi:helix-turn-helix domain-containing protein [Lacrimispora saccharolytica]|uniref:helix-turn-helix domain-containing protein n=1 Tax=Lacrimispora saccharolytica TaxID=84030 RepID=UPI00265CE28F|nr:helix-turn-helix domain-containing protein [Lacrimispora saccharolytica]MCF2655997.1 helix-turn-helix domain-containing protein [Lacrimispora saccharolytica]